MSLIKPVVHDPVGLSKRSFYSVLAFLLLSACASEPPLNDNYYSLSLSDQTSQSISTGVQYDGRLIVGEISLAEFLDQSELPLQIGPNKIQLANHNFWAEPLDEAIAKVLVRELSVQLANISIDRDAGKWTGKSSCRLRVEFDRFHATDNSVAVASGRYWLHKVNSDRIHSQEFSFSKPLVTDGYSHAIEQLRELLGSLSINVGTTVTDLGFCQ